MLVTRWQAPRVPDKSQMLMMFETEGLEPVEEVLEAGQTIPDHRHPFDEIRMVATGQLMLDIAGNQMLLRPGDKVVIPANTRHSKRAEGTEECVCICANQVY
jgi:quercetin dioxygenase-like cupin family protein